MYLFVPITAITRSVLLINMLTADKLLQGWVDVFVYGVYDCTIAALLYMQVPLVVEPICATVFYKTYAYWNCATTIVVITICWIWVILMAVKVINLSVPVIIILFVIGISGAIIIYAVLIKINYTRYHNGWTKQSLDERHQLFENVKSLYPIVSNLIIEIVFNIHTFICVFMAKDKIFKKNRQPGT
uniref:G_PROTEIN_RECEP_F1_2 domain-containing protein n=1 Tax=Panagrellus redivivus TaxID=6233 RepID=A0A7E4ZYH1_PANRE